MKNKKELKEALIEVIQFGAADVIATSGESHKDEIKKEINTTGFNL